VQLDKPNTAITRVADELRDGSAVPFGHGLNCGEVLAHHGRTATPDRAAPSDVDPTTSENTIVTVFRNAPAAPVSAVAALETELRALRVLDPAARACGTKRV